MDDAAACPSLTLPAGDLRQAAAALPGVLCVRPMPLSAPPGALVLAFAGPGAVLAVGVRRDHAGGFSVSGEAVALTSHRPSLHLRAISDPEDAWSRTLDRTVRLTAQLRLWLAAELAKDEPLRDLEALVRVRRGTQSVATVQQVEVAWSEALGCWSCLDLQTGELIRLEAYPRTLLALLQAGSEALNLASLAWVYSVEDRRTAIAVCRDGEVVRARRVQEWSEGQLVAYRAGVQVFNRR